MLKTTVNDCTVTMIAAPGSHRADVRITGDVDLDAAPVLDEAVSRVASGAPRSVYVDLAGVTFAGAALPNFLARAHGLLPRGCVLVVCRANPMTTRVLQMAAMTQIVVMRDRLMNHASPSDRQGEPCRP